MGYDTVNLPHMSTVNLPSSFSRGLRDTYRMEKRDRMIADLQRRMKEKGFNPRSLSMKATGKPDTVRNLLRGASKSWRQDNYEAVMRVLGEENFYLADDGLMKQAAAAIRQVAEAENRKLTLEQAMLMTVELYNHVIKYRKSGNDIVPNQAIAALIIKQAG